MGRFERDLWDEIKRNVRWTEGLRVKLVVLGIALLALLCVIGWKLWLLSKGASFIR